MVVGLDHTNGLHEWTICVATRSMEYLRLKYGSDHTLPLTPGRVILDTLHLFLPLLFSFPFGALKYRDGT